MCHRHHVGYFNYLNRSGETYELSREQTKSWFFSGVLILLSSNDRKTGSFKLRIVLSLSLSLSVLNFGIYIFLEGVKIARNKKISYIIIQHFEVYRNNVEHGWNIVIIRIQPMKVFYLIKNWKKIQFSKFGPWKHLNYKSLPNR